MAGCLVVLLAFTVLLRASNTDRHSLYPYEAAQAHELKPHRRTIPLEGVTPGFHQLRLTLTVSAAGEVTVANASGDPETLEYWPRVQAEVRAWKFTPFEKNGKTVTAEVEEYIDLVPPERLPRVHVEPPVLRADSTIAIVLERTGCYGTCPSYIVTVGPEYVTFLGREFVRARGKHAETLDASRLHRFAQTFVAADFYSMEDRYVAAVTDCATYRLSIDIDGRSKQVVDYQGEWVGMPVVINELENAVDEFAGTERWIRGGHGRIFK
jgi:hypothetical protein